MFNDDVCVNDYHPVVEHSRLETPLISNGTPMYDWCLFH